MFILSSLNNAFVILKVIRVICNLQNTIFGLVTVTEHAGLSLGW